MRVFSSAGGFSLAGVIVSIGLLSVISVALTRMLTSTQQFSAFVEEKNDREVLRMDLISNVNCDATVTAGVLSGCQAAPTYINLLNVNGKVLVAADGSTKSGRFQVRAKCNATGLDVRVAAPIDTSSLAVATDFDSSGSTQFRKEKMTKLPLDWNHPKAKLFPNLVDGICASKFGSIPSSTPAPTLPPTTASATVPPPAATALTCAAGQIMTGLTDAGAPNCVAFTIPSCLSGYYMRGINSGAAVCARLPSTTTSTSSGTSTTTSTTSTSSSSTPSGRTRTGSASCTPNATGPCAGNCGGDGVCPFIWSLSGDAQSGGCRAPSYMSNQRVNFAGQLVGYECWSR